MAQPDAVGLSQIHFGSYLGLGQPVFEGDTTTIGLEVKDHHLNMLGVVHGGVITTLSDTAMGNASFANAKHPLVTVELKVSFMRPAFRGRIEARARVLKKGEHLLFATCTVVDQDGREIAVALGTYMMIDQIKK